MFKNLWIRIKRKVISWYIKSAVVKPEDVPEHNEIPYGPRELKPIDYAKRELNTKEFPGAENNKEVVKYHKTAGGFKRDSIAWCSSFVNWCFMMAGGIYDEIRSGKANARSWLKVGEVVTEPEYGDLVIFWRGSKKGWKGHVGFFIKEVDGKILVLGGNQLDMVCYQKYSKSRVLGYRRVK